MSALLFALMDAVLHRRMDRTRHIRSRLANQRFRDRLERCWWTGELRRMATLARWWRSLWPMGGATCSATP